MNFKTLKHKIWNLDEFEKRPESLFILELYFEETFYNFIFGQHGYREGPSLKDKTIVNLNHFQDYLKTCSELVHQQTLGTTIQIAL